MKILLLNPPGARRFVRDNYCSKIAQAAYSYAPVDLLLASSRIEDAVLVDAIVDGLTPSRCLDLIESLRPDGIISLVSSVSWSEADRPFLTSLKSRLPTVPILVTGDVILEGGAEIMAANPWLDGIILDFTNQDALLYFRKQYDGISQMIYRSAGEGVVSKTGPRTNGVIEGLGRPHHELFLRLPYRYPFVRHRRFATVQTDYGCPYKCKFCAFCSLGYQWRPVQKVIDELLWLKGLGVKEIYFNDQTFGGTPQRLESLCKTMINERLGMGWCCWCRLDLASDRLELMKEAGCHTVMFGVESASEESLRRMNKALNKKLVKDVFARCRSLGLRTLGTFVLGLPGEDRSDIVRTIEWALELDPVFASFNVLIPRKGSQLRREAKEKGLLPAEELALDQSGENCVFTWGQLEVHELRELHTQALRRFYLRPSHWWRLLTGVRTLYDVSTLLNMGRTMAWGHWEQSPRPLELEVRRENPLQTSLEEQATAVGDRR